MFFKAKKPDLEHLRKKWYARHKEAQNKLWDKHGSHINILTKNLPARQIVLGGLGGLMMLTTPTTPLLPTGHLLSEGGNILKDVDKNTLLADKLKKILPEHMRNLDELEEKEVAEILTASFGMPITGEIGGIRLNRTYGVIGGEQHLYRYPGDSLHKHTDTAAEWAMYGPAGIAPGLGAWGYFAQSENEFTEKDKMREKYYLAVQTFLAPGFAENVAKYRDFFKFRKMLVINPKTGQAVVAVIGDAGPAEWTGKHLGGSPEVMHFLGLATGPRKGPVLYFFIDDENDQVPLGPVKVSRIMAKSN